MSGSSPARPLPDEVAPVVRALEEAATRAAARIRAEAEGAAAVLVERSVEQAERVLDEARRSGASAAHTVGAARVARGRRRAREAVLEAQREVYESLHAELTAKLGSQLDLPAGQELRAYLVGLVGGRAGGAAVEGRGPDGRWRAVAESPAGRASIDVEDLVVQLLDHFGEEVVALWR